MDVARRIVTGFDMHRQRFASLTDQLTQAYANFTAQERLAILCDPHHLLLQVIDDLRSLSMVHAPILPQIHCGVENGLPPGRVLP